MLFVKIRVLVDPRNLYARIPVNNYSTKFICIEKKTITKSVINIIYFFEPDLETECFSETEVEE